MLASIAIFLLPWSSGSGTPGMSPAPAVSRASSRLPPGGKWRVIQAAIWIRSYFL
jgi:hypothetical protein